MTEGKVFLSSDIPLSHEGQTLLFLAFCYALVALGAKPIEEGSDHD